MAVVAGNLLIVALLCLCGLRIVQSAFKEGDIRIIGGRYSFQGTVLLFHRRRWGSVCDKGWDKRDAAVVCKQLGYPGVIRAAKRSEFGTGRLRVWKSYVGCRGYESRLTQCRSLGWGISMCRRRWSAAGVVCRPRRKKTTTIATTTEQTTIPTTTTTRTTTQPTTTTKPTTIRPKTTTKRTTIRPKITTKRTTIRPKTITKQPKTTKYVTNSNNILTFSYFSNTTIRTEDNKIYNPTEATVLRNISSNIIKPSLSPDVLKPAFDRDVMKSDDSGRSVDNNLDNTLFMKLSKDFNIPKNDAKASHSKVEFLADEPDQLESLEVRLFNGRFQHEGRVEVRLPSFKRKWKVICGDTWGMLEAMAVCRQTGNHYAKLAYRDSSYFEGQDIDKAFASVKCHGKETRLQDCSIDVFAKNLKCSQAKMVAGVICTKALPNLIPNIDALVKSAHLQDRHLYYLRCAMEENCLSSGAQNISKKWVNASRRLMRFSTVVNNRGTADFLPYQPREEWKWHMCHMHYHSMEVFAHYDILDVHGNRIAQGHKASFCLEDTTCDQGVVPVYSCKGHGQQGLSVNCSDNYMSDIDCQWIDVSDVKPGTYIFQILINPDFRVSELNFDDNAIRCDLHFSGYNVQLKNCELGPLLRT